MTLYRTSFRCVELTTASLAASFNACTALQWFKCQLIGIISYL